MTLGQVLKDNELIIAPGAYDTISARIIEQAGFPVVYITGLGNEASDLGYPDLGLTTATELVRRASTITECVQAPVVCDADTGFGGALNLYRTVRMFESAGVSAVHIEDQTFPKRCGLLTGKKVIPPEVFARKIKAAVDSRRTDEFLIIARTDAKASSDLQEVIYRLNLYANSGADLVMLGDPYTMDEYKQIVKEVHAPIVAVAACHGMFSIQPDISVDSWKKIGVKMVIYWHLPLFSAMKAVTNALDSLKRYGTTSQLEENVFTYSEYERVVDLSAWLEIDRKYG